MEALSESTMVLMLMSYILGMITVMILVAPRSRTM